MRSLTDIRKLEREASVEYIRKLYRRLPAEPITTFEFELHAAITRDIAEAERELKIL